uniref:Variable outer membrane protein n=1 Tax=Romanomermis culicivorax TaxID=13658 RepID=A0A915JMZ2_ROMCU
MKIVGEEGDDATKIVEELADATKIAGEASDATEDQKAVSAQITLVKELFINYLNDPPKPN